MSNYSMRCSITNIKIQIQWTKVARMDFESPKLTALSKRVYNIPRIKSFIDNRPDRPF